MIVDKSEEKIRIGEITRGKDIGKNTRLYSKFIWSQCPDCKREKWVEIVSFKEQTGHTLCHTCSGRKHGKINKKNFGRRW